MEQITVLQKIRNRSKALQEMRSFFITKNFLEVDTPILVKHPGMEPNLTPFKTTDNQYLITSPEYHMKRLLAEGLEKIYQITKAFRANEEQSPLHNQEFTMVEWYIANTNYNDMAEFTEKLIHHIAKAFDNKNLQQPFQKITCEEAFEKHAHLNLRMLYENKSNFIKEAQKQFINIETSDTTKEIFFKILLEKIEPHFKNPTFLFDFPAELAALSIIKEEDPHFCERFELYINNIEIANAFSELTDQTKQESRLKQEQKERKQLGIEVLEIDKEFIKALQYMPKASGIALGFDRLLMALTGAKTIDQVLLFP